jgi:hypothetical protein
MNNRTTLSLPVIAAFTDGVYYTLRLSMLPLLEEGIGVVTAESASKRRRGRDLPSSDPES